MLRRVFSYACLLYILCDKILMYYVWYPWVPCKLLHVSAVGLTFIVDYYFEEREQQNLCIYMLPTLPTKCKHVFIFLSKCYTTPKTYCLLSKVGEIFKYLKADLPNLGGTNIFKVWLESKWLNSHFNICTFLLTKYYKNVFLKLILLLNIQRSV